MPYLSYQSSYSGGVSLAGSPRTRVQRGRRRSGEERGEGLINTIVVNM